MRANTVEEFFFIFSSSGKRFALSVCFKREKILYVPVLRAKSFWTVVFVSYYYE